MSVASKNLYALLGNDEEGADSTPSPVKTVTKTSTKTGKANADGSAPASGARPAATAGFSNTQKDYRNNFSAGNRGKPTDEAPRGGARGGRGARGRGGRGATHHRNADDRHTKNIVPGSEKQAAQSWGATDGTAELNDEQAGEAIAQSEQKDAEAEDAEVEAQEPEVKQIPLDVFLAKQAEESAALNAGTSIRKVNEGANTEQWGTTQVLPKKEANDFIAPSGGKKKEPTEQGHKAKTQKVVLDFAPQYAPSEGTREGRGGARVGGGDRGPRGGDRGPRGGDRADRRGGATRGAPRGAPRGGDGFPRGAPRGRGGSAPINPNDTSAFPSLGSK